MSRVHSIPFLRIVPPFLLGIILYKVLHSISPLLFVGLFIGSLLGALFFYSLTATQRIRLFWVRGILLQAVLLSLGYLTIWSHQIENKRSWYKNYLSSDSKIRAKILTPLTETKKTFKATVGIKKIYNGKGSQSTCGKAILYFHKTTESLNLTVGDEIVAINKLSPISNNKNPGAFNYSRLCKNKGIYEQAFLNKSEWIKLDIKKPNWKHFFLHWSEQLNKTLKNYITLPNTAGIAQALLTGYRNDIDQDIYHSYTKTGLVHLLAISGLHMGIFFLGVQYFLAWIPFFKKNKGLLVLIALISMWIFALITTFPPSVQRASVMFSFLALGQLVPRKTSHLNFLLASAFLLLLLQPNLLWEVGFQLSYAAVMGIFLLYKPLTNWFKPNNQWIKKIWQISCVSISAQLFTFPITLYYFHQTPTLFLVTNLIAIPVVTLIIYGEFLLILFSMLPFIAKFIGLLVSCLIYGLNDIIDYTSRLPFVSLDNLYISQSQCFLLIAAMLSITGWFIIKKKIYGSAALLLFFSFMVISINRKSKHLKQEGLVIYNAKYPYIEYMAGTNSYTQDQMASSLFEQFEKYSLKPCHLLFGIKKSNYYRPPLWKTHEAFDFIAFSNKKILRIKKSANLKIKEPISVDYLVWSDLHRYETRRLLKFIHPREIIIDGNIPLWKIEDFKSQLQEVDLPTHYVATEGAKIIQL